MLIAIWRFDENDQGDDCATGLIWTNCLINIASAVYYGSY